MLGEGTITSFNENKRLMLSSIEADLIGVNEALPQILWTQYFLKSQGYNITQNNIHQDNKCSITLETNRKSASSKRTKQRYNI